MDCLESGAEFETSGAETLKAMGLVYAGYQSAEENQTVDLSYTPPRSGHADISKRSKAYLYQLTCLHYLA